MARIIWQYSEEWQRQMGIFEGRPGTSSGESLELNLDDEEAAEDRRLVRDSGFIPARDKLEAVNRL